MADPESDQSRQPIAISRPSPKRARSRGAPSRPGSSSPSSARNRSTPSSMPWPPPPRPQAEAFARLAVEETGYGVVADKIQKNLFASQKVYNFIRPMKTVGVIARHEDRRVIEIAEPFGVVAAVVPSTNPTSTAIYKILICDQGALRHRPQPASVGRQVHHARRRGDGRGGAPGRRAAGRDQLDDDGDARRHAGADEAPRRRGDSGDRRHGTGPRGLQRGQAGLRRRPRATRRRTSSGRRT